MFSTGKLARGLHLLLATLMIVGVFSVSASPAAAADNGVVVSNGVGPNTRPSVGTSPDKSKVCVVWSTFDQTPSRTYIRLYDAASGVWQPALGLAPYDVTKGSGNSTQGGSPRCTIDASGRTHVVWAEGATKWIQYSSLDTGKDPGQKSNWLDPLKISNETDAQSPDIATLYADAAGQVWLAYTAKTSNTGYDIFVRRWVAASGWGGAQQASTANGQTAHYSRIAVDNAGNVHVTYWQGGGGGIRYTYRDPGTGQFIPNIQLPGSGNAIQYVGLAVNPATGDVHVVYSTPLGDTDNTRVVRYVKKVGSTGTNFSQPKDLTSQGNYVVPRLGLSTTGRVIMVVDQRDVNPSQIVYAASNDHGASWGPATALTDGGANAYDPGLAVGDNGAGYVAYWNKNGNTINFVTFNPVAPGPPCAGFADVTESDPACPAIAALTVRKVIYGYATNPPTFGPADPVLRAQMAAFLVRDLGWGTKPTGPKSFTDFGPLVGELRDASLRLANACDQSGNNCVAQGYDQAGCAARGVAYPCFGPNDSVTYAQVISFISRAYVYNGTWTPSSAPHPYTGVPPVHDQDVRTYYANGARPIPNPPSGDGWNQPAPRAWVAMALYRAATP